MDRAAYNRCMTPFMKGSKTREQRQFDMCVGAKACSGKAASRDEAERICSLPKEPKQRVSKRKKGASCEAEVITVSQCMLDKIDFKRVMNQNSFQQEIVNALVQCQCQ